MVTEVALAATTVNVDEPPEVIDVGLAVTVTAVAGFDVTVTVVVPRALPPAPVAVAV
jgi:hypothetical protein